MPTIKWDDHMAEKLKEDPGYAPGYLNACLEEGLDVFKVGLKHVIDAMGGATAVAKRSGISRESVYKAYRPGGNPTLNSLHALLSATGMEIQVKATPNSSREARSRGSKLPTPDSRPTRTSEASGSRTSSTT